MLVFIVILILFLFSSIYRYISHSSFSSSSHKSRRRLVCPLRLVHFHVQFHQSTSRSRRPACVEEMDRRAGLGYGINIIVAIDIDSYLFEEEE